MTPLTRLVFCGCSDRDTPPTVKKNRLLMSLMTGNLDIIRDEGLRRLCSYGTKFREVPLLDSLKVKKELQSSVDHLISKLASSLGGLNF